MIIIRLKRRASKSKLSYSIVVTSSTAASGSNQFLEKIGHYNPIVDSWSNKYLYIDFDRFKFWVERGARVNMSLFVLLRGLLSYQSLQNWTKEEHRGSTYAVHSSKTNVK